MSDANQAIDYVLEWEGKYVDNPRDVAGATNYGISLRFYQQYVDAQATKQTIQDLTKPKAIEIYHDYFWSKQPYAKLTVQPIANYLFDMAVHCGQFAAIQSAQRALWSCIGYDMPKDDGVLGDLTINALNGAQSCFMPAYKAIRAGYYRFLVGKNPALQPFINDWIRRAYQCYTLLPTQLTSSPKPPQS